MISTLVPSLGLFLKKTACASQVWGKAIDAPNHGEFSMRGAEGAATSSSFSA
jgi:hypothetical protein